jgi:prepilin-type N-terminal cleavage/methylation domain-containing protein
MIQKQSKGGRRRAEGGRPQRSSCASVPAPSPIRHPPSPLAHGFTLIELLVTMVIIAIISAAILGTAASAFENARRSRTRSLVTKISGLVLERWDSYAERRVEIDPDLRAAIDAQYPSKITAAQRGQMLTEARLLALRELMKFEMPDRWSDIVLENGDLMPARFLPSQPGLALTYARFYPGEDGSPKTELAECLYMTVMFATGDGEARTLFTSQDIGDTDDDGAPEFIDGWGEPIGWIRWPAGYISDMQPADANGNRNLGDHDPFDPFRRDAPEAVTSPPNPRLSDYPSVYFPNEIEQLRTRNQLVQAGSNTRLAAVRLVPLVFSSGSDQEVGLLINDPEERDIPAPLDPYLVAPSGDTQSGQVDPDTDVWRDNIANHVNIY